jgi:tetratricopeptide (TPR) repeat protein
LRIVGRMPVARHAPWALTALLLAGLGTSGCAYFNTFYHARRDFHEAESKRKEALAEGRESNEAPDLYEKSIQKCAKIIVEYPKSRWVDDALLIMGEGFFYRGEYTRALKKFEELVTYYPRSPFVPEARWFTGLADYRLERRESAREVFRSVVEGDHDPRRRLEARVMLARTWQDEALYDRCTAELEEFLPEAQDREQGSALLVLGDCRRAAGHLETAIEAYERAARSGGDRTLRFDAELKKAEVLTELGRVDETRGFYETLLDEEKHPVRGAKLRLAMGRFLVRQGDVGRGIELLEKVAEDPALQEIPGDAQLEIASALEKTAADSVELLEKAVLAYEAVGTKRPKRETSDEATGRKQALGQLVQILKHRRSAPADSAAILDFAIAEQYLFALKRPDLALGRYRRVAEDGQDATLAARSLLALAWIRTYVEGDSTGALPYHQQVVEKYPETEFADHSREVLGLPPRPKPQPADTAAVKPSPAIPDSLPAKAAAEAAAADTSAVSPPAGLEEVLDREARAAGDSTRAVPAPPEGTPPEEDRSQRPVRGRTEIPDTTAEEGHAISRPDSL